MDLPLILLVLLIVLLLMVMYLLGIRQAHPRSETQRLAASKRVREFR